MHLAPIVEATTLAECADRIGEGMVHVMEKHLIPAVTTARDKCHDSVQHWPRALRIILKEPIPWVGMREACDQCPRSSIAAPCASGDAEHKHPGMTCADSSKKVYTRPKPSNKSLMLQPPWEPFAPELLVALAPCGLFWKVAVPFKGEHATCVVESKEVDNRDEPHGKVPILIFHQPIQGHLRIPTKLSLCQQIDS